MTIRKLDAFFRTQITLDQPQFFNSITNLALAPLQRLVGQKQFPSLEGKASHVPQITAAAPSGHVATLFKVVVFVCDFFVAIVLTPIGVVTRSLSFWSPQIDQAYSHVFLLELKPSERTPEVMESACTFIQKMTKEERTKLLDELPIELLFAFFAVPAHYNSTREYLDQRDLSSQKEIIKNLPISTQVAFLSQDSNAELTKNYLLEIPEVEYDKLMPHLSPELIELYNAQHTDTTQASQKQPNLDDLDTLLNDTLDEFMSHESPLSVPSGEASSLASICIKKDQIEHILAKVPLRKVMSLVHNLDDAVSFGQEINYLIGILNLFFTSLLQNSDHPKDWLEQEPNTSFYSNCHPFAASYFLITHLDQATDNQVNLDKKLIAEWKGNYQKCVLLLKQQNLNQYNETEFPFSTTCQLAMQSAKTISQNPFMMQQAKTFAQNLHFESSGNDSLSDEDRTDLTLIDFFQELNEVLIKHPKDAKTVETWLISVKDQRSDQIHFFLTKFTIMMASFKPLETIDIQLKSLYESCSKRLIDLGLQKYVDETPSPEIMDQFRQLMMSEKEFLQLVLSKSLSVLRPLSKEIQKLKFVPEENDANRQVIEKWITSYKKLGYFPSFTTDLNLFRAIFENILDKNLLDEFTQQLSFCREQLLKLGLNVEEIPIQELPQKVPTTRSSFVNSAAKQEPSTISISEINASLLFFQKLDQMLKCEGKTAVEKWLKDVLPKLINLNPFFTAKTLEKVSIVNLTKKDVSAMINVIIPLSKSCRERLKELGLQKYINENPPELDFSTDHSTAKKAMSKPDID